ncbi:DUF1778 domain-containing protein [Paramicrobacterium agarici]|uniref:Uncharacterized protein (DUF1778 family) n=1 Tax=Paramicrobacterium agarici TaxID=630514 RepID=A0A2A9DSP1_9MICO|nr:DUF1778 domain-containing protein [Microbacterium agarici]PFG29807.1 uncharacterized protein (DUF1778 family) [Microbacterium agarici]TQO22827.1 uncharacterized protein (DUF1778 family) [Microbacterium agarici]
MAATERLEFRVSAQVKATIQRAADLVGEPVTAFARSAAEARADRVLREHDMVTVVPDAFFDDLMAALDAPAIANPALVEAGQRLRASVTRA